LRCCGLLGQSTVQREFLLLPNKVVFVVSSHDGEMLSTAKPLNPPAAQQAVLAVDIFPPTSGQHPHAAIIEATV
jgi:hypothetical protein